MAYDKQILQILAEAGERGISVLSVARHVFNLNRTFFVSPDFSEIHAYVQHYLRRNSLHPQSLVEHTGRRGFYRLNVSGSADARQLMFDFSASKEEKPEEPATVQQDLSLSLFDF